MSNVITFQPRAPKRVRLPYRKQIPLGVTVWSGGEEAVIVLNKDPALWVKHLAEQEKRRHQQIEGPVQ